MKSPDEYVKAVAGGLVAAAGAYVAAYQAHAGVASEVVLTIVAFAVAFGGVYSTVRWVKAAVAGIVAAGAAFTGAYGHSPLPLVITMTVVAGLAGFSAVRWTNNTPPATKR